MSDASVFNDDDRVDDVEALLRELDPADLELVEPPADLWAGIESATHESTDNVVSLADRRSQFGARFLAAAAAVAVIAVGAVVVTSLTGDDATVVASAELVHDAEAFDPLGADAAATAELVELDDGYEIHLDEASLPDPDGEDLELWMIAVTDDGSLDVQPVSLVDPADPGVYSVPDGLDPATHSIVDISIEPRDGDETHSGRSILRGELAEV